MAQELCSDWWELTDEDDYTIAKFALPRLRRFKEVRGGYPGGLKGGEKKWEYILGEIEWYLETIVEFGDTGKDVGEQDMKRYKKAQKYWGKYFGHLWW